MRVTIKDIASRANVSVGTVDRVLHNRGEVNASTKAKVLDIAKEMGYVFNLSGKGLAYQRYPKTFGVVALAADYNLFAAEVLRGIQDASLKISDYGVSIKYYIMNGIDSDSQKRLLEQALDDNLAGILIKPVDSPSIKDLIDRFVDKGIPVVTFSSDITGSKRMSFVGHNHRKEGRIMGRCLSIILPQDSNLAVIASSSVLLGHKEKFEGLSEVLRNRRPDITISSWYSKRQNLPEVISQLKDLNGKKPFSAICAYGFGSGYLKSIFSEFTANENIIFTSMGERKDLAELFNIGLLTIAMEENPYEQGYVGLDTLFNIVFEVGHDTGEYMEVPSNIVLDECFINEKNI